MCNDICININSSSVANNKKEGLFNVLVSEVKSATYSRAETAPNAPVIYELDIQTNVGSSMVTFESLDELRLLAASLNHFLANHATTKQA